MVNRLYEGHGSVNLVLHEHGHSLDSLKSRYGYSHSKAWKDLMKGNPAFVAVLREACGSYCADQLQEGFAEAIALYHSCEKNRKAVADAAPEVAAYLTSLAN